MLEQLLRARGRYAAMIQSLSGQNPLDLTLRRDLETAIAAIDAKLAAEHGAPYGADARADLAQRKVTG